MRRRPVFAWVVLNLLANAALATAAFAQAPRVLMVDLDPTLERATEMALAPWRLDVRSVTAAEPGSTMPGSAERGRQIAVEHDALAVVWVSSSGEGFALWVYDRRDDRVVARGLPSGPPFDEPTAAEIALAIKTLLRVVPAVRPPVQAGPSQADGEPAQPVPEEPDRADRWSFLVAAGARAFATSPSDVEARFALGITFWPALLEHHLGFTLIANSGPGVVQDTVQLRSRWTSTELLLAVRGRLPLGDILDLGILLGVGARFSTLDGEAGEFGAPVEQRRLDPHSRADLEIGARATSWLRFEFRAGAQFPWRVQRYWVEDRRALEVTPVGIAASLGVELSL